jgi:hypothetical protein
LVSSYGLKAEPFVSFPGEKVVLEFNSKVSVEMDSYYNYTKLEKCSKENCPLFENNSLRASGKKKFTLNTAHAKPGFYSFKVVDDSNNSYYSSIAVRPDHRVTAGFIIILLTGLFFAVTKNDFGRH